MIYLKLLLISFITCYIVTTSGVVDSVKYFLWNRYVKSRPFPDTGLNIKPFDCPKCMTFWIGLIAILYYRQVSIYTLSFVVLLSLMAENMVLLQYTMKDLIGWLIFQLKKII